MSGEARGSLPPYLKKFTYPNASGTYIALFSPSESTVLLQVLKERDFPYSNLKLLASAR